jgi:hypothetical protein
MVSAVVTAPISAMVPTAIAAVVPTAVATMMAAAPATAGLGRRRTESQSENCCRRDPDAFPHVLFSLARREAFVRRVSRSTPAAELSLPA